MEKEKRPAPLAQREPQPMEHTHMVTVGTEPVKNRLRDYREARGVAPADIIAIIQKQFPKYDKTLHSKCENVNKYAVEPCEEAFKLLDEHYGIVKKHERRTKANRVICRLSEEDYQAFKAAIAQSSYATMQAYLERTIKRFINRHRKENT